MCMAAPSIGNRSRAAARRDAADDCGFCEQVRVWAVSYRISVVFASLAGNSRREWFRLPRGGVAHFDDQLELRAHFDREFARVADGDVFSRGDSEARGLPAAQGKEAVRGAARVALLAQKEFAERLRFHASKLSRACNGNNQVRCPNLPSGIPLRALIETPVWHNKTTAKSGTSGGRTACLCFCGSLGI